MADTDYLNVWFRDKSSGDFHVNEESQIDAAVSAWIESGGTRDVLIHATGLWGCRCAFLASYVQGWQINSTETHRRYWEIEKGRRDEARDLKTEVGIIGEDI